MEEVKEEGKAAIRRKEAGKGRENRLNNEYGKYCFEDGPRGVVHSITRMQIDAIVR